ncbi:MAG TPA: hypothetical protein VMV23_07400 [Candidatus Nanopelagicaceae bacterium]|nr:hypothetical protein [Candidatus Nanopelagicaceae bacterium]
MEVLRVRGRARRIAGEFFPVAAGLSDSRSALIRGLRAGLSPEVSALWVTDLDWLTGFGVGVIEQPPRVRSGPEHARPMSPQAAKLRIARGWPQREATWGGHGG